MLPAVSTVKYLVSACGALDTEERPAHWVSLQTAADQFFCGPAG